ncbi:hypothetical protein BKA82DRAFT_4119978 [Pisolithus tinctorius]|nr:hypothetical protein BKA82DRAFT_4119978 [Pisolithus tinctorius]
MTITIIIAPTQVLRYVPFFVNASVGDTTKFVWNPRKIGSNLILSEATIDTPEFASRSWTQPTET